MLSEREIQRQILDYLEARSYDVYRFPLAGAITRNKEGDAFMRRNPMAGFPDLFGFFRRVSGAFAIEVKRPGQYPRANQARWITKLNENNIVAITAWSVKDVEELISEHDR